MEDWIQAVRDSVKLDDVFPVAAEPTLENAESWEKRIAFLLAEVVPKMIGKTLVKSWPFACT